MPPLDLYDVGFIGVAGFIESGKTATGDGLCCGGTSSGGANNNTSVATNYIWSNSADALNSDRYYMAGGRGYKQAFIVLGGWNGSAMVDNSQIFNGTSWATGVSMVASGVRRNSGAYGGNTESGIVALGTSLTADIDTSAIWNGSTWASAGVVGGGAAEFPQGDGTVDSFIVAGGVRGNAVDTYNGDTWSYTGLINLSETTVISGNMGGASAESGHIAGGDYNGSFDWDGSSWTEVTAYGADCCSGDDDTRYVTGGGVKDSHWIMTGHVDAGVGDEHCGVWDGDAWTETGDMTAEIYAAAGDGTK